MAGKTVRLLICIAALLIPLCSVQAQPKGKGKQPQAPSGKSEKAVAIVNGKKIPYIYYQELYSDQISYQLKLGKSGEVDQSVDDQIFMQLVDNELIRQEAARKKINVTRDQAVKALLANPPDFIQAPFTDEKGVFHAETFRQVVLNPNLIAQMVGAQQNREKIVAQWKADLESVILFMQADETKRLLKEALHKEKPLTPNKIKYRYFAERTRFTGSFIRVLHSTVPDSLIPVTEAEARKWYDTHQEDYRFSSARKIATMIIPIRPLTADSTLQKEKIATARSSVMNAPLAERGAIVTRLLQDLPPNRMMNGPISVAQVPEEAREAIRKGKPGELVGPFRIEKEDVLIFIDDTMATRDTVVRARHIIMKVPEGDTLVERETRETIELLAKNIDTYDKFQQGVQFYSQDGTTQNQGDLGFVARGMMVPEFEKAAFAAPIGKVVGPIRTKFGYHLIWVDEKFTTGYRIRELRYPFSPSRAALEAAQNDAIEYAQALRADRANDSLFFEFKAKYPGTFLDTSLVRRLDIYGDAIAPANFAFSSEPGDVGVMTLPFDRIMIAKLLNAWPAGVAPYDGIRSSYVMPHVRRVKQLDYLAPTIDSLKKVLTPTMMVGTMRLTAPMAESFMVQNQFMTSPPDEDTTLLDSLVWATPVDAVTGPVRGTHAYYFLRVQSKSIAPTESDYLRDKESFTRDFGERYREMLLRNVMTKAREYAEVVDLRPNAGEDSAASQGLQRQQ